MAKELVHVLKFGRARQAAECIGEAMLPMLGDLSGASLVVSYIPTATNRVRQRGYDQSALIARHVARQLGLPFRPLLCRRGRQRQLGKNRSQRATQLASVFWTNKNLTNTEILLIDDVITTGSSMHAAGRILTQAGASRIITAAFAHA
ncbi:MAG TPA: phosphoribosyltransferase family protein [Candidatus Saccharimonadales bacterium]